MARYGKGGGSWTAQEFMQRIGRTPAQQKYYDVSGNPKSGYSSVASQQNSTPVYTHTGYNSTPQDLYKAGAPIAAPGGAQGGDSYASAQRTQGTSSINFAQQLADIKAQNQSSLDALTKQMTDQKADYDAREVAANKKISNLSSTVANAQSQYDPTKGMGSSNNINPALTIQEKSKSLSSGTERYNRSKLSINNLNV